MLETIVWALLTGGVTGGVWVGIVLTSRRRRAAAERAALLDEVQQRVDELAYVDRRLAEAEERLDFTERLLADRRDAARRVEP
jgi:hypothetical protein